MANVVKLTGVFGNLRDLLKNEKVCNGKIKGLTDDQVDDAEHIAHLLAIQTLGDRVGFYFNLLRLPLMPTGANKHIIPGLKPGTDKEPAAITPEQLLSFGVALKTDSSADPANYKATIENLAKQLIGGSNHVLNKAFLHQLITNKSTGTDAKSNKIGSVIKEIDKLIALGANTLRARQKDAGSALGFVDLRAFIGGKLPVGLGLNPKFTSNLVKFLDARFALTLNEIKSPIDKTIFERLLFETLAKCGETNEASGILKYLMDPGTNVAPPTPFVTGDKIDLPDDNTAGTRPVGFYLGTQGGQNALGFTSDSVAKLTKAFLVSIKDQRIVINDSTVSSTGRLSSYYAVFIDKFDPICREFVDPTNDSATNVAEQIGNPLELKRRRLQNIRCVLPLFEHLYSSPNAQTLRDPGLVGVYSKHYTHTLGSQKTTSTKLPRKFFASTQHPLVFAHTKNVDFFINKLFNYDTTGKKVKTFLETTNTDISFLQPRIRIYKVLYDDERNEIEIPIEFSNKIEIVKPSGVYERENAGIKRIRINRLGQTPATFDKWISVDASFIFDSVNAFTKCRKSNKEYSYVDLLRRPIKYTRNSPDQIKTYLKQAKEVSTKDDIKKFAEYMNSVSLDVYNPEYFEIKLEVGWSFNEQVFVNSRDRGDLRRDLKDFLNRTNLVLYLYLTTHNFTFRNDGTISLDIKYMGRAAAQLMDSFDTNVFHTPNLKYYRRSSQALSELLDISSGLKTSDGGLEPEDQKKLRQMKNRLTAKLSQERSELTSQLWKRLVDQEKTLLQPAEVEGKDKPTHMLKLTMPEHFAFFDANALKEEFQINLPGSQEKEFENKSEEVVLDPALIMAHYRAKLKGSNAKPGDIMQLSVVKKNGHFQGEEGVPQTADEASRAYEEGDILRPEDFDAQQRDSDKEMEALPFQKTYMNRKEKQKKIDVYCMRYGSVIHTAVQNIWQFNPEGLRDIVIMLSGTKFRSVVAGGGARYMNFADVPILFEDWKRFILDKTVNKKKVNYALIDFIRDSMMELLIPAMGAMQTGCKDGSQIVSPLRGVRPKLTTFSARRPKALQTTNGRIAVNLDVPGSHLKVGQDLLNNKDILSDTKGDLKHFLVIYDSGFSYDAEFEKKTSRPKLYDENLKHNIPHFFIGANKGILRTISFQKSSVPFLQEAKVLDRGHTDFGLLREKYDCTLEVVGDAQFHCGMRFYLDPTFTGMSSQNIDVVQGVLGLGGYYDIINVNSDISDNGFKTTLVGSWQAFRPGYNPERDRVDPCKEIP